MFNWWNHSLRYSRGKKLLIGCMKLYFPPEITLSYWQYNQGSHLNASLLHLPYFPDLVPMDLHLLNRFQMLSTEFLSILMQNWELGQMSFSNRNRRISTNKVLKILLKAWMKLIETGRIQCWLIRCHYFLKIKHLKKSGNLIANPVVLL